MAIIHVNQKEFKNEVLLSEQVVLVDFWASWCGPCQMLAPVLEKVSAKTGAKIVKVNVDEEPQLAMQYGISSIPTLLVFQAGKVVNVSVGLIGEDAVEKLLKI